MAAALVMTLGACSMPLEGVVVKPAAPGKPALKAGSSGISITWDKVTLAKSYQVYCAMNPEPPSHAAFSTTETSADIRDFKNNTTYYVWVRAENERGLSPFSEAADITTADLTPGEPELTYKDGGIIVNWEPVPVADSYNVYYAADPSPPGTPQKPDITGTSVTITGVTLGAAYYVWVEGVNSGGKVRSRAKSIELYLTAPEPVLTAGDGSITVNWEPVPLAGSYNVYYAADSTPPENPQKPNITGTSVSIAGLSNESTYYVWVEAVNTGEEKMSDVKSVKLSLAAPVPVLTPQDGGLTINWEPVPLANSYNVYYAADPTPPEIPQKPSITGTSVSITGLSNGAAYYVWVEAVNSGGKKRSDAKSAKLSLAAPVPVLTPQDGGITVSWEPVPLANSYNVYCAADPTPPGTPYQSNITGTSVIITGLSNGAAYYVWVEAVNSGGTAISGAMSVVTQALAAPVPVLTPGDGGITVSWEPVPLANSYNVYCAAASTPPGTPYQSNITGTSVIITGLSNGTAYYVWVEAVNSGGTAMSGAKSVITPSLAAPVPVLTPRDGGITVSWEPVPLANSYNVYYAAVSTPPGTPYQSNITGTSIIIGLSNGAAYYVWVEAVNSGGTAMSGAKSVITPSLAAPAPVLTPQDGGITVSWEPVPLANSYNVYCAAVSTPPGTPYQSNITGTSIIITGLSNGAAYYVWVEAVNSGGTAMSGAVSGVPQVVFVLEYTVSSDPEFARAAAGINASSTPGLYRINLAGSITADSISFFPFSSGKTIIIRGDTVLRTIYNTRDADLFTVPSGTALVLENNVSLNGNEKAGRLAYVDGGTLVMKAGSSIEGAKTTGVYVENGVFTMEGGEISGNTVSVSSSRSSPAYSCGGGVYISGGTFTMSGGKISGNMISASSPAYSYGGGVYISGGAFTMSGGKISGNVISSSSSRSAYSYGGGVYISGGAFTMSDGEISGNTASSSSSGSSSRASSYSYGGGVCVTSNATFTMSGGTISRNAVSASRSASTSAPVSSYGGGVYVTDNSAFTMSGGTISGNTVSASRSASSVRAYSYGGGVYVKDSRFIKKGGGTITDTNSAAEGKAVCVYSSEMRRDAAAGPGVDMDTNITGSNGGWEQ
jgi:fibronectin type 3 domain-containing protein